MNVLRKILWSLGHYLGVYIWGVRMWREMVNGCYSDKLQQKGERWDQNLDNVILFWNGHQESLPACILCSIYCRWLISSETQLKKQAEDQMQLQLGTTEPWRAAAYWQWSSWVESSRDSCTNTTPIQSVILHKGKKDSGLHGDQESHKDREWERTDGSGPIES